jgi:two-component sensor histidine kinase
VQAERMQRLLNHELSHRLKNTLAMVQAIAGQTLKGVADQEAVEAFTKRLHALGTAHHVLLKQNWSAAPIHGVVEGLVETFDQQERFSLSGPKIELGAHATLSTTLILHELTTNSLKYGSLSLGSGTVEVAWSVDKRDGDSVFRLVWRERGGPPVCAPTGRGGFGT